MIVVLVVGLADFLRIQSRCRVDFNPHYTGAARPATKAAAKAGRGALPM
jgi:hypothetical protein